MPASSAMRRIHLSDLMLMSGILDDDFREQGGVILGEIGHLVGHAPRNRPVYRTDLALAVSDYGGIARIGLFADTDVERKRAQEFNVIVLAHLFPAARAEDGLLVSAVRADVRAHVL